MNARIPSFAVAYLPEPTKVLGVKLRSFSLGHYILMQRYENPYVAESEVQPSIHGLIMGIVICSRSYEDFLSLLESENWWENKPVIRSIAKKISRSDFLTRFPVFHSFYRTGFENFINDCCNQWCKQVRKAKSFNIMEHVGRFSRYIKEGSKMPNYIIEKESKTVGGSHWSHNVLVTLTSELGYSHTEALNMPFGKALYDYMKHAESVGAVRLLESSEELEEELKLNSNPHKREASIESKT